MIRKSLLPAILEAIKLGRGSIKISQAHPYSDADLEGVLARGEEQTLWNWLTRGSTWELLQEEKPGSAPITSSLFDIDIFTGAQPRKEKMVCRHLQIMEEVLLTRRYFFSPPEREWRKEKITKGSTAEIMISFT